MLLDQRPADIQPQSQPNPRAALDRSLGGPVKALPEGLLPLSGDAGAGILHPDAPLLAFRRHPDLDGGALWGVFERIAQIVAHHLPDPLRIGIDEDRLLRGHLQSNPPLSTE